MQYDSERHHARSAMQYHRPSTFGVGMKDSSGGSGAFIPPVPYDGFEPPKSDRENAQKMIQWMEERTRELQQAQIHAKQRLQQLSHAGITEGPGLEKTQLQQREIDGELRSLEVEKRNLQRKLQILERKDSERRDAEEASRHRYHKLASKRPSVMQHPGASGGGGRGGHMKRHSVFGTPSFIPGFDPTTSALAASQAPDLNLESPLDQELFLERVKERERRDEKFEQQFGRLSIIGGGHAPPPSRRTSSVGGLASRKRSISISRRSSSISSAPAHSRRNSATTPRARHSPMPLVPSWAAVMEEGEEGEEERTSGSDSDDDGSNDSDSSVRSRKSMISVAGLSGGGGSTGGSQPPTPSSAGSQSGPPRPNFARQTSVRGVTAHVPPASPSHQQQQMMQQQQQQGGHEEEKETSSHQHQQQHAHPSQFLSSSTGGNESLIDTIGEEALKPRPMFLTQAAEASAADLSNSLANFLQHSTEAPKALTATEALIDPHLREKISKALQAYIQQATQAAMDRLLMAKGSKIGTSTAEGETTDTTTEADTEKEDEADTDVVARPSREEELLWGLLMGTLRTEEEEQLAIEWWTDREKQLYAELAARRRKREERELGEKLLRGQLHQQANHPLVRPGGQASSGSTVSGGSGSSSDQFLDLHQKEHAYNMLAGASGKHAARGALLSQLALKQEELRQLKAGQLLTQLALKSALDNSRAKDLARTHGAHHHLATAPVNPIEPMCRRFVLSVVSSALANAGILQRQDRTIKELKWAISKAKRVAYLTANGSINRPASARSTWVSAVSVPTPMPRLTADHVSGMIQLTTEPDPIQAMLVKMQHGSNRAGSPSGKRLSVSVPGSNEPDGEAITLLLNSPDASRAGRGWIDPLYTPQEFSSTQAEKWRRRGMEHLSPPPPPVEQRKVMKSPRPVSAGSHHGHMQHTHVPGDTSDWPVELAETEESLAAQDAWLALRARPSPVAHTSLFRRGSTASMEFGGTEHGEQHTDEEKEDHVSHLLSRPSDRPSSASHVQSRISSQPSLPIYEDPSLLGAPPALHVAKDVVDEWSLFVTNLDQREIADRMSLTRSAPVTTGPSVDPTKKANMPKPQTPAEKFASGASVYGNPLSDIPRKERPKTAYQGLTLKHPHFDKQGDRNEWMKVKDAELRARARKLQKVDGGKLSHVLSASKASFNAHFRSSSNSWDWLPIDLDHPARKCPAGCKVHYEVDVHGATALNPLGNAPNPTGAASSTTQHHQPQRPQSARVPSSVQTPRTSASPGRRSPSPVRRPQTASSDGATKRQIKIYASATNDSTHVATMHHPSLSIVPGSSRVRVVKAPKNPRKSQSPQRRPMIILQPRTHQYHHAGESVDPSPTSSDVAFEYPMQPARIAPSPSPQRKVLHIRPASARPSPAEPESPQITMQSFQFQPRPPSHPPQRPATAKR